jgi:TonB-dependent receptor
MKNRNDLADHVRAGGLLCPLAVVCALALALVRPTAAAAEMGALAGTVSNSATKNLLQGARVEVPQLGLTALTDSAGSFVLPAVPTGTHEHVVSYIGLDTVRTQVTIAPGQRVVRDFDLTTGIYQLDAFKVVGEREGFAVAITERRNAPNLKDVVSMDQFGNLPNMSSGEILMRMAGVAGSPTEEGLNYKFNIRGMPSALNTINIDGARVAALGFNRDFEMQSISGAMFDQMELIKGLTPDKSAESLGGSVNMKTRSTLNMKENRRFTYNFSVRVAPSFTEQIPTREQHRSHPVLNFGYQELFGVFGGQRNLGVAVNAFYSENAVGFYRTDRDFQNTTNEPAYLWSYQTQDNYNNRKQIGVSVKTEYRLSRNTTLTLNTIANDNVELSRIRWIVRAYTGSQNQNTVPNATTSSIVPGFTDRITEVRAVPTSTIDMNMVGPNHYITRTRRADLTAEQEFGPLKFDYSARYARNNLNSGQGNGGDLTMRITNVGWILDRTQSDLYPRFVQTAGPDISNAANWRPRADSPALVHGDQMNDQRIRTLEGNARYTVPIAAPMALRTGFNWRDTLVQTTNTGATRYDYIGTGPLPANPNRIVFDQIKTGRRIPQWDANMFISDRKLLNPSLWSEDRYYVEQQNFSAPRTVLETVTAGYLMAQGKFAREGLFGRTGYLAGVRTEKTEMEGYSWSQVRASLRSTTAQRLADPAGSARRDYVRRDVSGSYIDSFPSVHLMHDITPNLKARVSWSTGFGRPGYANATSGESVNENAQTVTVNNPGLLPQHAKNWDATLDYYFEPVGNLSVGFFHKKITDYIVSGINTGKVGSGTDNGFNGEYAGYDRFTSLNAGTAFVQGWEFGYQQQFTFLPGVLKGLGGSANYTVIDTHGDFGGRTTLSGNQVAGFIPRVANVMLSWRYRSFSTRVLYNRTSDYIASYDAANPGRNSFRQELKTVNFGVAYLVRPSVSLNIDVSNVFNAPQVLYRGIRSHMQTTIINGVAVNFGVSGRF